MVNGASQFATIGASGVAPANVVVWLAPPLPPATARRPQPGATGLDEPVFDLFEKRPCDVRFPYSSV
jgi:hypothetical protein